ncbi:hypothetical protein [Nocardioides marmoraquaticus]
MTAETTARVLLGAGGKMLRGAAGGVVRPPTSGLAYPNRPAGYALLKTLDFSTSDSWALSDGWVKESGTMDASKVFFGQGPSGKSVRLDGGRDTAGGTVRSSEIRGNIGTKHATPNYCYEMVRVEYSPLVGGTFPAAWKRGLGSGFGDGELDHWELFGNFTAHANMHTTPYSSPTHRQAWRNGMPTFQGVAGGQHTIEALLTPTGYSIWWDGAFVNTFTPTDFNANATPTDGTTLWSPQFDTAAKTWQPILSNQWCERYNGPIPTQAFSWSLWCHEWSIFTPPI